MVEEVSIPYADRIGDLDSAIVEAIDQARNALRDDLHNPRRWLELGMVYHAHEQFDLASECYVLGLELDPPLGQMAYYLGLIRHDEGAVEEAIGLMEIAITLDEQSIYARWRQALWTLELGKVEEAKNIISMVLERWPHDLSGRLVAARISLQAKEFDRSCTILESIFKDYPNHGYAHVLYGMTLRGQGKLELAQEHLTLGAGTDSELADGWMDVINLLRVGDRTRLGQAKSAMAVRNYDLAIDILEELRKRNPEHEHALITLAEAYRENNQLDNAETVLQEVILLNPNSDEGHLRLGLCLLQNALTATGEERESLLLRIEKEAVIARNISPTWASPYALMADVAVLREDFEGALGGCREAIRLEPGEARWVHKLARLLAQLQRWQEVVETLERGKEKVMLTKEMRLLLATGQANSGDLEGALATLVEVRQGDMNNPKIEEFIRVVEEALGQRATDP